MRQDTRTVGDSSRVRRYDCASVRARLTSTRASAVSPAKARQMFSSIFMILRTVRGSCSFAVDTFSTPEESAQQLGSALALIPGHELRPCWHR